MSEIRRAIVKSYDAAAHKATVQIAGSLAVWLDDVRVATNIPAADVVAGRQCTVLFLDPSNQDDAVIIAIQGAAPSAGGGGGAAPDIQEDGSTVKTEADPIDYRTGFDVDVDGDGVNIRLALDEFTFDAVVDGNGNDSGYYATLQAAIDAGAVAILVITDVNTEAITISADSVRLVQGVHQGIAGPTFTTIADPDVTIRSFTFTDELIDLDADRIRIEDCIFNATATNRSGIDVNSGADDCVISRCRWKDNDSTYAINVAVGGSALRTVIRDCDFEAAIGGANVIRLEALAHDTVITACRFSACACSGPMIFFDDGGGVSGGADDVTIESCVMTGVTNGGIEWKGENGTFQNSKMEITGSNTGFEAHFFPGGKIVGCTFTITSGAASGTICIEDTNTTGGGFHAKVITGCSFRRLSGSGQVAFKPTAIQAAYWSITGCAFTFLGADCNSKTLLSFGFNAFRSAAIANPGSDTQAWGNVNHDTIGVFKPVTDDTDDLGSSSKQFQYFYGKPVLRSYTDAGRPAASGVPAGTMIFNTDDNFPNVSDGTNWRDMAGATT